MKTNLILPKLAFLLTLAAIDAPAETILFKAAVVHRLDAADLAPGEVLVEGAKIVSVDSNVNQKADKIIDLGAAHLYPGLIATATTVGLTEDRKSVV